MELMFSLIEKFDYPSPSLMNEATPFAMKKWPYMMGVLS